MWPWAMESTNSVSAMPPKPCSRGSVSAMYVPSPALWAPCQPCLPSPAVGALTLFQDAKDSCVTIHSKTLWQVIDTLFLSTDAQSLLVTVLGQSGLKPQNLGTFPEVSDDAAGILIPGSEPAPEEVWCPQDHVLKVLQGQPPIMVAVCFIQHLLTDQGHLLSTQLPTGEPGHCLLQVPRADVVIIVEVCEVRPTVGLGRPGGRRTPRH